MKFKAIIWTRERTLYKRENDKQQFQNNNIDFRRYCRDYAKQKKNKKQKVLIIASRTVCNSKSLCFLVYH